MSGWRIDRSASDFRLGPIKVRPRERVVEADGSSFALEPLVIRLLVLLSRRAGQLITRGEIFELCWGSAPVGDDSLNRLVAALRKTLELASPDTVAIQTVSGAGYVLRLRPYPANNTTPSKAEADVKAALEAAHESWRLGLPEPDYLQLESMRRISAIAGRNAEVWGTLALLCRHAAEYAPPEEVPSFVRECEASARRCLMLDEAQPGALTALASVAPLFGRWLEARISLVGALEKAPHSPMASHDLAIVEMATGRVREAKAIIDRLAGADPLAACYVYKSVYQHWSVGDWAGLNHVADRGIHLWPHHPAIWTARLWTLAYTGRLSAAADMLADEAIRPPIPLAALRFLSVVIGGLLSGSNDAIDDAIEEARNKAATGPAQAIASMFALGLLNGPDALMDVAEAYYLRSGAQPVPVSHSEKEMAVNDQYRRVTQILFTPAFERVRGTERFSDLCEKIGLTHYWEATGLLPDYMGN